MFVNPSVYAGAVFRQSPGVSLSQETDETGSFSPHTANFLKFIGSNFIFFSDAFLLFSSASNPAPDEVLEVLGRLCLQLLCISTF